jgi:hypothetical protein
VTVSPPFVGVYIPNFLRIQLSEPSADGLHLFQHDLVYFLLSLHELGHDWGNVWRSLLVKLRLVAMVQERSVLVEIMAIIPRSLLELSAPLVILIGILVVVAVIPQTLPTLNPFLEFR